MSGAARAFAGAALLALAGCDRAAPPPPAAPSFEWFREAAATGLDFVHFNGMTGELHFAEMMGPGVALLDVDGDGDLDVYCRQGLLLGLGQSMADALFPSLYPEPLTDRLYRNDLEVLPDGQRRLRFTDVTTSAGLHAVGYAMGVTTGDADGDGDLDLYLTNFGPNQLLLSDGDGTFTDATTRSGTNDQRWSVPALFFDYDRDGDLDLYVGNYVDLSPGTRKACTTETGAPDYCGPAAFSGEPDRLLRNRGDGTFDDVTVEAGLVGSRGPALGAIAGDFDDDGWSDLYVGNDGAPNFLWRSRGDGRFEDTALLGGSAVNAEGLAEATMGIAAADYDHDGDEDLLLTHLTREHNTLYRNDGRGMFDDVSNASGLGLPSLEFTTFGVGFFDFDHDGMIDVLTANGAVKQMEAQVRAGDRFPLKQRNQLFRGLPGGRFEEVTAAAGPAFAPAFAGRGVAVGGLDEDGDVDAVIASNNGPARLLLNQVGQDRPWVGLRLVGGPGDRDQLGAKVELLRPGRPPLLRFVRTTASYASANDPRLLFALGDETRIDGVRVRWPDNRRETFGPLPAGRYHTLRQGEGEP